MKSRKLPSGVIQLPVVYQTRAATRKLIKGIVGIPDNVAFFPFERLSFEGRLKYRDPCTYEIWVYRFAR